LEKAAQFGLFSDFHITLAYFRQNEWTLELHYVFSTIDYDKHRHSIYKKKMA